MCLSPVWHTSVILALRKLKEGSLDLVVLAQAGLHSKSLSQTENTPPPKKKQKGEAMAWNIIFAITSKNLLKLQLLLIVSHF